MKAEEENNHHSQALKKQTSWFVPVGLKNDALLQAAAFKGTRSDPEPLMDLQEPLAQRSVSQHEGGG